MGFTIDANYIIITFSKPSPDLIRRLQNKTWSIFSFFNTVLACVFVTAGLCFRAKEHGSLPHHIARTLTARKICLGHRISSILIQVHSIGYFLSLKVNFVI